MRATLTVIIVTWSLIVLYIQHAVSATNDVWTCSKSVTEECELEWSQELGDFQILPVDSVDRPQSGETGDPKDDSTPPFIAHNNIRYRGAPVSEVGTVCIVAPPNHHVLLQISLKPMDDGLKGCPGCTNSCLAFQNLPSALNERFTLPRSNVKNKSDTRATVSVTTAATDNTTNDTKYTSDSVNKTIPIERYARHSQIHLVERNMDDNMRNYKPDEKSRRKCKKCRWKRLRRKERKRRRKLRFVNLLFKYSKLLFQAESGKVRKPRVDPVPQSFPHQSRLSPTGPSALQKVFNKINRLVQADQRDSARHRAKNERNKRQTQNRSLPHDDIIQNWNSSALPFVICGLDIRQEPSSNFVGNQKISSQNLTSHRVSTLYSGVRAIDSAVKDGENISWISLENAFNVSSNGPSLKLDALHQEKWNSALLRHVSIKVSFVLDEDGSRNASLFSSPSDRILDVVTLITSKPGKSSVASSLNVSEDMTLLPVRNDPVSSVPESGSNVIIIVVTALPGTLVIIFLVWLCYRLRRRRKGRMRKNSAESAQEDRLLFEQSSSPIYRSKASTCSDAEREIIASRKHLTRQQRGGCTSSAANTTRFRDDEIKMYKCSRGKKKKLSHAPALGKKQTVCKSLHKCGHLEEGMGLSQHRHCIVCQIAEKPHRPIMGAQYEFLPPASQISNAGSAIPGSPHSHTNFDKFNRMQNNPYRGHSPSLSFDRHTLPSTINLPDGEELYRHHPSGLPNSVCPLLRAEGVGGKNRLEVARFHGKTNSIKSPPNRTVFDSEGLPFLTDSQYRKNERANGYPGPPSGICHSEHCKMGRAQRAHIPQLNCALSKQREQLSYIHCLTANEVGFADATNASQNKYICKCFLKHIEEPPPEPPPPDYSDVVRDDMLTSNDKQYEVTCFGDDVTESPDSTICNESSAHRRI